MGISIENKVETKNIVEIIQTNKEEGDMYLLQKGLGVCL